MENKPREICDFLCRFELAGVLISKREKQETTTIVRNRAVVHYSCTISVWDYYTCFVAQRWRVYCLWPRTTSVLSENSRHLPCSYMERD